MAKGGQNKRRAGSSGSARTTQAWSFHFPQQVTAACKNSTEEQNRKSAEMITDLVSVSGPWTLLQWSKSKPSSALKPSRRQLNLMAKGRSWPIRGYGASSLDVFAQSWNSEAFKPLISRWSKARAMHLVAVSWGPMLKVFTCRFQNKKISYRIRPRDC